ncbi:lipopolysaccharide export system permease protein [Tistlia consotensis]|uniref:Lipopolysaccharide export system permease protein n=1 Tax=Tistlia consotensis USBA 355 TaxID=560819 RepID=A0A1Y6C7D4_9PROT|nr:LPS export ABC transporter permease LptF [Tistlia consotensis]SMF40519.1 lipopolysaccharide export system permease protein [Tistlia consotensis USBA 355]SNR74816.1 lipopolysaccharide export system permease protein [Tistlia consotensis]
MRSLDRYIFSQLGWTTIAVTIALTFAIWLTQSLRLFDYIVNRGLPADKFLEFAALLMPSFLGVVVPIASFVAVLFVYNKMIGDRELVVLRAAGLSQGQLARAAVMLCALSVLAGYFMTIYLQPASFRAFKDLQFELRHDLSTVLLQDGVFNELADGLTVYVRERLDDGELLGIMVSDQRDPKQPVTIMAKRGALVHTAAGSMVVMFDGNRQQFDPVKKRLSMLKFDRYSVELGSVTNGDQIPWRWREPPERFIPELIGPPKSEEDVRYRAELIAEFHQRIVIPLYTIAFVSIGLAAMLGGEFDRRGRPRRLAVAVMAVGALEGVQLALQDMAQRTEAVDFLLYLPPIVVTAISLFFLYHRPRRPRRAAASA